MPKILILLLITGLMTGTTSCASQNEPDYKNLIQFWNLPTGSEIAYIPFLSGIKNADCILYLHGGPSASMISGYPVGKGWYQHLAISGYDVYIFDQVGCGFSERLKNPEEYTIDRLAADLEEIRKLLKIEKMILIGDSHGATLAANYMARFPGNVKKLILTSPGSIDPCNWDHDRSAVPQVSPDFISWTKYNLTQKSVKYYSELQPAIANDLLEAYRIYPDNDMDKIYGLYINDVIVPECVHQRDLLKNNSDAIEGFGFWAHTLIIWHELNVKQPVRNLLKNDPTPVLILRGTSDYLPTGMALEYRYIFRNSVLREIEDAGHFIWMDAPESYCNEIEEFLLDHNKVLQK